MTDRHQFLLRDVMECNEKDCPRYQYNKTRGYFIFPIPGEILSRARILFISEELPPKHRSFNNDALDDDLFTNEETKPSIRQLIEQTTNDRNLVAPVSDVLSKIELPQEISIDYLWNVVLLRKQLQVGAGVVPRMIYKILGRSVDVMLGDIYWTHTLKCIPKADHEANKKSFSYCVRFLQQELDAMPDLRYVVTFGDFVFKCIKQVCHRHSAEKLPKKMQDLIEFVSKYGLTSYIDDREIEIRPFYHPARWVYGTKKTLKIREVEKNMIREIRQGLL